jgi:hypothetical protein
MLATVSNTRLNKIDRERLQLRILKIAQAQSTLMIALDDKAIRATSGVVSR